MVSHTIWVRVCREADVYEAVKRVCWDWDSLHGEGVSSITRVDVSS